MRTAATRVAASRTRVPRGPSRRAGVRRTEHEQRPVPQVERVGDVTEPIAAEVRPGPGLGHVAPPVPATRGPPRPVQAAALRQPGNEDPASYPRSPRPPRRNSPSPRPSPDARSPKAALPDEVAGPRRAHLAQVPRPGPGRSNRSGPAPPGSEQRTRRAKRRPLWSVPTVRTQVIVACVAWCPGQHRQRDREHQRPHQVELLLHPERPVVEQRRGRPCLLVEVACALPCEVEVGARTAPST